MFRSEWENSLSSAAFRSIPTEYIRTFYKGEKWKVMKSRNSRNEWTEIRNGILSR